jgi:Kdo2-lipid IVA lauroyltransferase/acyltransferase
MGTRVKLKHHLIYHSARALMGLIRLLPLAWVLSLGRVFGALVFALAGRERRKTLGNIRIAFPKGFDDGQVGDLARAVWVRLGQNLFEMIWWRGQGRDRIMAQVVRSHGTEHLRQALSAGKGALVITGHLGTWELLGGYISTLHPVSAVAQNLYDPRFDRIVTEFREKDMGFSVIKRGLALRGILAALKAGHVVYAAVDQDTGKDGVFVPFFGKSAWTQSGVARIAQKTGAPIVPAFLVRGVDGRFECHVERPLAVPRTKDHEADVLKTVRLYTEAIESYVKAYPDQWMWMHERWKTRPKG